MAGLAIYSRKKREKSGQLLFQPDGLAVRQHMESMQSAKLLPGNDSNERWMGLEYRFGGQVYSLSDPKWEVYRKSVSGVPCPKLLVNIINKKSLSEAMVSQDFL